MKTKNLLVVLSVIFLSATLMSFISQQDKKKGGPWEIPAAYKSKKAPASTPESIALGKMLWAKHCKSCHGNLGLGDGPKAASLATEMRSFKDPAFQAQTDGTIYYQSFVGRGDMPNFEKKVVEEEERWALVHFIRTLK